LSRQTLTLQPGLEVEAEAVGHFGMNVGWEIGSLGRGTLGDSIDSEVQHEGRREVAFGRVPVLHRDSSASGYNKVGPIEGRLAMAGDIQAVVAWTVVVRWQSVRESMADR
jgi:hypothetical protein